MKISTRGRYGLRVMIALAERFAQGVVPVHTISAQEGVSGKYIHLIAMALRSDGLVRSVRGPNGGYELTKDPSQITVLDIVAALEGPIAPVTCVLDQAVCDRSRHCPARGVWCELTAAINTVLASKTLKQLCAHKSRPTAHSRARVHRHAMTTKRPSA